MENSIMKQYEIISYNGMPVKLQEGTVGGGPHYPCCICIKKHTWDELIKNNKTSIILICINCVKQFNIDIYQKVTPAEIMAAKLVLNI
jgi:hypothetical protein